MTLTIKEKDALMRVVWTTLQVGIPFLTVYLTKMPAAYVPLGTVILAVLKNLVTARSSNPGATTKDPS
jgi:hypothetical protein